MSETTWGIAAAGRGGSIDTETPPALVAVMGWLFLIGMPLLPYLLGILTE